jgi:hypothetical protein
MLRGTVDIGGVTYEWGESRGGARTISIHRKGISQDNNEYRFDPEPHQIKKYNKDQAGFYDTAARAIGNAVQVGGWPSTVSFDFGGYSVDAKRE